MKWRGAWVVGVLLLAACGDTRDVDLEGVSHATVSYADGFTFSTRYSFALSERVLVGRWSKNGPGGYRAEEGSRSLSEEEAAQLQQLVDSIRITEAPGPGLCWEDTDTFSFQLTEASGTQRSYPTDPERQSCSDAKLFADKGDVQEFFFTCRSLLPEPPTL